MANKYTTVADVSSKLNGVTIDGTSVPTLTTVEGWIEESSNELEVRTGKVWASTLASSVLLDYDGTGYLRVPNAPIVSVTKLEYNKNGLGSDTSDWVELTQGYNNDFIVSDDAEIKFFTMPNVGAQRLRITYTYGYAVTPLWIQKLCTDMTARAFISSVVQGDAKEQGGSVTVGNISISDPSTFSSTFLASLDSSIDKALTDNVSQSHVYRTIRNYSNASR